MTTTSRVDEFADLIRSQLEGRGFTVQSIDHRETVKALHVVASRQEPGLPSPGVGKYISYTEINMVRSVETLAHIKAQQMEEAHKAVIGGVVLAKSFPLDRLVIREDD